MNDFDYDARQKKNIAASARHRVSGAKSKRCTLPSDYLTEKQRQELNGAVESVNLNKPITWQELKALPPSLAKEYCETLHRVHKATIKGASRMFGVDQTAYKPFLRQIGAVVQRQTGKPCKEDAETFARFLGEIPATEKPPEAARPAPEMLPTKKQEPIKQPTAQPVQPDSMTISITGSLDKLAGYISLLPMDGKLKMTIMLEKVTEE